MRDIFNDGYTNNGKGAGPSDEVEDVNVDLISMMPDEMAAQLATRTLAMTTKLSARVKVLNAMAKDAGEGDLSRTQLFMAAVTERLALFEMLINSLANKAESDSKK